MANKLKIILSFAIIVGTTVSNNCVAMRQTSVPADKIKRHWQIEFEGRIKELEQQRNVTSNIEWLKKFKKTLVGYGFVTAKDLDAIIDRRINAEDLKINNSSLRVEVPVVHKTQPATKQPQKVQEKTCTAAPQLQSIQQINLRQMRQELLTNKAPLVTNPQPRIDALIGQLKSAYTPFQNSTAHLSSSPSERLIDLSINVFWRASQANDYNAMMNLYRDYFCNSRYNEYILGFVMNKLNDAIDRNEAVFIFDLYEHFIKNTSLCNRALETLIIKIKQGKLQPDTWGIIGLCFVNAPSYYADDILPLIAQQRRTVTKMYTQSLQDHFKAFRAAVIKHDINELYKHQNYLVGPVLDQKTFNAVLQSAMK